MKKPTQPGYLVEFLVFDTGLYAAYAGAPKRPLTLAYATSMAVYLKNQGQPGRLIKLPENEVVEQWGASVAVSSGSSVDSK